MANPHDEPLRAADCIVAQTPGLAITIPATPNEFAIKGNHLTLVKRIQFDVGLKLILTNTVMNFSIMDAMTLKMDAQYKEMKSHTECNHCGGSKILYSIKGTPIEDKIFAEFDEFIAMNIKENIEPETDEEEISF
nr:hypothetical protein [Tanacetum cinerariifolium]